MVEYQALFESERGELLLSREAPGIAVSVPVSVAVPVVVPVQVVLALLDGVATAIQGTGAFL